jgi:integration host factor subunit alpha
VRLLRLELCYKKSLACVIHFNKNEIKINTSSKLLITKKLPRQPPSKKLLTFLANRNIFHLQHDKNTKQTPGGITMSLTKSDLITKLNEHAGLSRKDSASAVESTFDIMKSELESGNDVKISGLGKWTVKAKKERKGRNPQTGKSMAILARKVVTFKTSLVLKGALNS